MTGLAGQVTLTHAVACPPPRRGPCRSVCTDPPSVIESIYSGVSSRSFRSAYELSNHVGFALFDVLVIVAVVLWLVFTTAAIWSARRRRLGRATARIACAR